MEKKLLSFDTKRERRFMLVMPLIFVPFLSLMFWAFKGINDFPNETDQGQLMDLPEANFLNKDIKTGKMEEYERAKRDSILKLEKQNNDPYLASSIPAGIHVDEPLDEQVDAVDLVVQSERDSLIGLTDHLQADEQLIYDKLQALNHLLKEPEGNLPMTKIGSEPNPLDLLENKVSPSLQKEQVDRLENLMGQLNEPIGQDEELNTLNSMLETIRAIQSPPERSDDRLGFQSTLDGDAEAAFEILASLPAHRITRLTLPMTADSLVNFSAWNRFHSMEKTMVPLAMPNTITAVIHQSQSLISGDVVKLRVTQAIQIGGLTIPEDSFVYGLANLNQQRLEIQINRIRMGSTLIPVDLKVYDLDGLAGIHIPGALIRDVAKESAGRSVQSIGLQGIDQSWGTQAAIADVETAKNLIQKKVRLVRVSLHAGYQVLLMDGNQKSVTIH